MIDEALVRRVDGLLKEGGPAKSVALSCEQVIVRLDDAQLQTRASDIRRPARATAYHGIEPVPTTPGY